MCLVEDDDAVATEGGILKELAEEGAVGQVLDAGGGGGAVLEPDGVAHEAAHANAHLVRDAARHGDGGDATGLGHGDAHVGAGHEPGAVEDLRHLRRLAGARLADDHDHGVLANRGDDLACVPRHGELVGRVRVGGGVVGGIARC